MKIKTNFTPGPWRHEKKMYGFSEMDAIGTNCQYDEGKTMHVTIGEKEYAWSTKESQANARLIAAAPEMFQVLIEVCFPGSLHHTIMRAKKLIEKITGKTIAELEKEK